MSNASAFLAGHEAQYDIGLGLLDLLLDQQPQPSTPSALMVLVVPVLAWLVVAALLAALARDLARLRVHGLPAQRRRGARGWVRALLPGAVLIASGGGLLIAAPLGLARHFYPDGGWAVTAGAWIALTWGLVRVVTAVASSARARRLQPPAATPGVRKSEAIWEP